MYALLIFLALIFEALPISSSGHMRLLELHFGKLPSALDHLLHGPFALAIALSFFNVWAPIARNIYAYRKPLTKLFFYIVIIDSITLLGFIARASLPAISLWGGFFITSIALLSLLLLRRRTAYYSLTPLGAIVLGLVQALSLLAGISRFATTYVAARWLGLRPDRALQLSFCAHVPLTLGGLLLGLYKGGAHMVSTTGLSAMALGTLGATVLLVVMQRLASRQWLWVFGLYLLFLQLLAFWYGWSVT